MTAALACADRGLAVALSSRARPGAASGAAAGLLAPIAAGATDAVVAFATACRDSWPSYVAALAERSRTRLSLNRLGIIQLPVDGADADRLRNSRREGTDWLEPAQVAALEPTLSAPLGAVLRHRDGAVDNEHLMLALDEAIAMTPRITLVGAARGIRLNDDSNELLLADGDSMAAGRIVLAAGAWVPALAGLPRALPIVPVRGQMIGFAVSTVRHVVEGPDAYLVPRPGQRTIVGATMEQAGFDAGTTASAAAELAAAAGRLVPRLASLSHSEHWAGLRPMTPDQLPILGPDPDHRALLYACGHSRNGILMATLTAECIGALAAGEASPWSLAPFSVTRFT